MPTLARPWSHDVLFCLVFECRATVAAIQSWSTEAALELIAGAMQELLACLDANDLEKTLSAFSFYLRLLATLPCLADASTPDDQLPKRSR